MLLKPGEQVAAAVIRAEQADRKTPVKLSAKEQSELWGELGSNPDSLASEAARAIKTAMIAEEYRTRLIVGGADPDDIRAFAVEVDIALSVAWQALASCLSRLNTLRDAVTG